MRLGSSSCRHSKTGPGGWLSSPPGLLGSPWLPLLSQLPQPPLDVVEAALDVTERADLTSVTRPVGHHLHRRRCGEAPRAGATSPGLTACLASIENGRRGERTGPGGRRYSSPPGTRSRVTVAEPPPGVSGGVPSQRWHWPLTRVVRVRLAGRRAATVKGDRRNRQGLGCSERRDAVRPLDRMRGPQVTRRPPNLGAQRRCRPHGRPEARARPARRASRPGGRRPGRSGRC